MDRIEERIVEYIDQNSTQFIAFLQKLLRIPSKTGEEKDAQLFIYNELKKYGCDLELFEPNVKELFSKYPDIAQYPSFWIPEYDMPLKTKDVFKYNDLIDSNFDKIKSYKDRPNVIGILKGNGSGKSLILNGHIDVVTVEPIEKWKHDPWAAEIEEGKIFARGASDMKGGIAAMLKALEAIIKNGVKLNGDIILQSVVNEEHSGSGSLACVSKGYKADAAIITEPSGSDVIVTESGGGVYWEIIVKGRETHAGSRWIGNEQYGISAIEKIPLIISNLLDFEKKLNKDKKNISLCIGMINGGNYSTSTALTCRLNGVAYFSADMGTGEYGLLKVKNMLIQSLVDIDDEWLKNNPPEIFFQHYDDAYKLENNGNGIKELLSTTGAEILGEPMKFAKMNGACDARHLGNRGNMPVIVYGPGTVKTAHSVDEYIEIDDYIKAIKILALTIYRWAK